MSKQNALKFCPPRAKKLVASSLTQQEIWRSTSGSAGSSSSPRNGEDAVNMAPQTASQGFAAPDMEMKGKDLAEKIKELLRLAQEQGHLTYNDINETLCEAVISVEQM